MTAWSLDSVNLLAHGVHYAFVAVGLVGLSWLLLPQLVDAASGRSPLEEHQRRVAALRSAVEDGTLLSLGTTARPTARYAADATLLLPAAVVCTAAAAGVHAAMGPAHLWTVPAFGIFFTLVALAQMAWTAEVLRRPTTGLLHLGLVLNAGLVLLWLVTRTAGLPLGLMPVAEPIGTWDLAAVAWQVGALVACLRLLGIPSSAPESTSASTPASTPAQTPAATGSRADRVARSVPLAAPMAAPMADWHRGALALLAGSAIVLVLLSLGGVCG